MVHALQSVRDVSPCLGVFFNKGFVLLLQHREFHRDR